MLSITDAIAGVEIAQTAYTGAVAQTQNDKAAADAIQAKLDAQNLAVAADQKAQADAATALNGALDSAIEAFQAAKIPTA
jgi:hypothetical protein